MLTEKGIEIDYYCRNRKMIPKKPPVGFVVALIEGNRTTVYLYTGESWAAIKAYRTNHPDKETTPDSNKVIITRNPNGDSRTAEFDTTYIDFQIANRMHISDVERLMNMLGDMMSFAGTNHDYTKITDEEQFFKDFKATLNDPSIDFTKLPWYQLHIAKERHHLNNRCPDNVTLIDVMEMICDVVAATAARKGEVGNVQIPDEILQKAVKNTVALLANSILLE